MRLHEIEIIPKFQFNFNKFYSEYFNKSTKLQLYKIFEVRKIEYQSDVQNLSIFLYDTQEQEIASILILTRTTNSHSKYWQSNNAATSPKYRGQNLIQELYRFLVQDLHQGVLSDFKQSDAGKHLWMKKLPQIGLLLIANIRTGETFNPGEAPNPYDDQTDTFLWLIEEQANFKFGISGARTINESNAFGWYPNRFQMFLNK